MSTYTTTVNMSQAELKAWLKDPRNLLASIDTGHESLRRLSLGDEKHDRAFAKKVDNFNTRHALSNNLFGKEVGGSGWSKRAIALKNWGHDPSKKSSPLYEDDRGWLADHPGAEHRRKGRVKNPTAICSIEAPTQLVDDLLEAGPFFGHVGDGDVKARSVSRGRYRVDYIPQGVIREGMSTNVPYCGCDVGVGVLVHPTRATPEAIASAEDSINRMVEQMRQSGHLTKADESALCQLSPALASGVYSKHPDISRTPNPPLGKWILPLAQLLVSASGLFYSLSDIASIIQGSNDDSHVGDAVVHKKRC
jgi:hypothetical protein